MNLQHFYENFPDTPLPLPRLTLLINIRKNVHGRRYDAAHPVRLHVESLSIRACWYLALNELVHYDVLNNMAFLWLFTMLVGASG